MDAWLGAGAATTPREYHQRITAQFVLLVVLNYEEHDGCFAKEPGKAVPSLVPWLCCVLEYEDHVPMPVDRDATVLVLFAMRPVVICVIPSTSKVQHGQVDYASCLVFQEIARTREAKA